MSHTKFIYLLGGSVRRDKPSLHNLLKRIVPLDNACIFYQESAEDTVHSLFYNREIQSDWLKFMPYIQKMKPHLTFLDIEVWVWKRSDHKAFTKFFLISMRFVGCKKKQDI